MKAYNHHNVNKFVCYSVMALIAILALGVFAALPLVKGNEAWLAIPALTAAAFFIGYIQNRCTASHD